MVLEWIFSCLSNLRVEVTVQDQKIWTVGLIDDEPFARQYLKTLLSQHENIQIVFESDGGYPAVDAIRCYRPDILFMDVEMPDLNGLQIAQATIDLDYYLIFLTAHDDYALQAFKVQANDYLVKPVRDETLFQSLEKIVSIKRLVGRLSENQTVSIGSGSSLRIVDVNHILFVEAMGKYRMIHLTEDGTSIHKMDTLITETTLSEWSETLPDHSFTRIHRKFIVNHRYISRVTSNARGHAVRLRTNDKELPVSRSRVKHVMTNLRLNL